MKTVMYNEKSIIIEEEKKKFFSRKIKKVRIEIELHNINEICREEYQGLLNAIVIFYGDNQEERLLNEEYMNLEKLYRFLLEQNELGKRMKITTLDLEKIL